MLDLLQRRLDCPLVREDSADGLPAYEDIGLSITVTNFEDFRELSEREAHDYGHLAMARATWFRLVMRHFAPSPTSETVC